MSCEQLIVQQVAIDIDAYLHFMAVSCESLHDLYHDTSNLGAALILLGLLLIFVAATMEGAHL